MPDLERELFAIAGRVEVPAERDLWPGIRARLEESGAPRGRWLRTAVVAAAVVAAAFGIAFAVPTARAAILRLLGLEGVTVVRVDELPPVTRGRAVAGQPTTLDGAAARLGFRALLPDLGTPAAVYLDPSGQAVLLLYGSPARLRLEETRLPAFTKIVTVEQQVEGVTVNGGRGIWVSGTHVVVDVFSQPRLSGSTLLWEQDGLTIRLEGRMTEAQALRIARSIRPR